MAPMSSRTRIRRRRLARGRSGTVRTTFHLPAGGHLLWLDERCECVRLWTGTSSELLLSVSVCSVSPLGRGRAPAAADRDCTSGDAADRSTGAEARSPRSPAAAAAPPTPLP